MSHLFCTQLLTLESGLLSLYWFHLFRMYRPVFFVPCFCCSHDALVRHMISHIIRACEYKPLCVLYKVGHGPVLFSLPRVAFLGHPLFLLNPGQLHVVGEGCAILCTVLFTVSFSQRQREHFKQAKWLSFLQGAMLETNCLLLQTADRQQQTLYTKEYKRSRITLDSKILLTYKWIRGQSEQMLQISDVRVLIVAKWVSQIPLPLGTQ